MTKNRMKAVGILSGATLLTLAGIFYLRLPSPKATAPAEVPVAVEPAQAQPAEPKRTVEKAPAAATPPLTAEEVRAMKTALAASGEAARIAIREQRLDELDWSAPRPAPSAVGPELESKSERALPIEEKIRQTETVIRRLKDRIAHSQAPETQPASTGFDNRVLVTRLQRRVSELEERVQSLRQTAQPSASDEDRRLTPSELPSNTGAEVQRTP